MSAVSEIISRLQEADTPFASVSGAADLASIENGTHARPAAFVLTVEEASGENERLGDGVLQPSEADIAVVIALQNFSDVVMAEAADDIETFKTFVRGKLLGFVPTVTDMPITHVSGQLLKARNNEVWFEDKFAVSTFLESQS